MSTKKVQPEAIQAELVDVKSYRPDVNRAISAERTYNIGPYQSLKLFDSFSNLPEDAIKNPELVNYLRQLQFIQLELGYRKYAKLFEELGSVSLDESIQILETLKLQTMDNVIHIFEANIDKEN
jgi:hypothetical protein